MHQVLRWPQRTRKKQKTCETTQVFPVLNSQIQKSQNPRIRSNNHTKTGSQEGKTGQGNQEQQQNLKRRSAGYHSATVVPDSYPNSPSLVRRNSYTITSSLLRTSRVFIDSLLVNRHEALNPLYCCCCCCLLMFQVAACIADRVSGAAALFKVIVSSSLDFFDCNVVFNLSSVIFIQSLCIFPQVQPIFSNLWLCWSNYCWFDSSFRLGLRFPFLQVLVWGNHWCHLPISFSVFQSQTRVPFSSLFQPSFTR